MEKEIEQINKNYTEGLRLKDIARKSDEYVGEYKTASENFLKAGKQIDELLVNVDDVKINFKVRSNALKNYYFYEANECLYGYEYKNGNYKEALEAAKNAKFHIEEAVKLVHENLDNLNDETKKYLSDQLNNWKLSQLTVQLREIEPIGQGAMRDRDYVTALDSYRKMDQLQDKVHRYVESSNLPEVFKRTEKGNYLATKASIAMTLAGIYTEKSEKNDYAKDILEQFLDALYFIRLAQNSNPEQDRYKDGYELAQKNITKLLKKEKDSWFELLIEFADNKNKNNLIKIMSKIDIEQFKLQSAKLEIEKNKTKRFILTFGFMLSIFLVLGYFLWQVALSSISWFRFLALLISMPVLFTILGAFALRTTDSLKEENFLKLMELAFKINLQGLKAFSNKKNEQTKTDETEN